jgi:transposase-like protein
MGKTTRTRIEIPEEVRTRYEAGELTAKDVGRSCGVSVQSALVKLRQAGVDTSKRSRFRFRKRTALRPQLPKRLVECYVRGDLSSADLARSCGVSPPIVLRELQRLGVDTSAAARRRLCYSRRPDVLKRVKQIVTLYLRGHKLSEIARRVDRVPGTVRYVLIGQGIIPSSKRG